MTLSGRVAYNTIIQISGKFISTALGLFAVAIMARYLGQTGFGRYTTVITFLSFFAIISDFGLTLVTAQMISRPETDQDKILSNLFGLRLVSAAVLIGLAPLIAFFLPYEAEIKKGIAIAALSFFFAALNQIFIGLFQKSLRLEKVSVAEIAGRIVLIAAVILSVYFNLSLKGVLLATVAASAVNFFLLYFFSSSLAKIKFGFEKDVWLEIIKKTWPLAITIAFNLIYLKADTLILSLIKDQSEVGLYGAAYRVIDVLVTIPFMFAGLILPILTLAWAEKDGRRFKNIFQKSFDAMAMAALPILVGAQFTADRIMVLVAGKDFAASGPVLKILLLAAAFIFLGSVFSHGIIAIDRQKKIIGAYVFTAATALAGYLIFIPTYSYFGAAWVTIYSELTIALFSAFIIWRYADFFPNFKVFLKSILASTVMASFLYLLPELNLFLTLGLAAAIYASTLYLFGGLSFIPHLSSD